ncbi:MAG: class C beta-lactamase-related serine hydrolase [Rhodobacteraceae bacterium]|nr:MAG: class C beta-lactamase-related serine hydrolase [Paracoccaceae bacterium]
MTARAEQTSLSRRAMLATGLAAAMVPLTPIRARAAQGSWDAVADQARGLEQLRSLVIAHQGEVILAEAFRGPALTRAVNVKSVSKTIVAAVTGAAIDRGVVPGITARLGEIAPDLIPSGADPRVSDLTLEHLVTMQAGLERTSGANYGAWVSSRNWVANALSRPFVAEPGRGMLYSTGSFHVLGAALSRATGQSLLAMTRDWLGRPLGIEVPGWTVDPQGFYLGGNEMAFAPLDLIRFAEMTRLGGQWDGQQVLSPGWMQAALEPRTRSAFSGLSYGYGWFLGRADGVDYALARGFGGQVICVAPARGLSVVITSDPTLPARSEGHFGALRRLIDAGILPAAQAV